MHIHILGICGTFMGGLAALAREAGHKVTGCDAGVYPPMSDQLRALGIDLIEGYDPVQLGINPDVFVVGNVVKRGNPLMEAILDAGVPYTSGPQWLAENILPGKHVLAVAGTHGKTTTSAMLAWILECSGKNPGFLIGGVPENFGVSARLGGGEYFVIEADEYDTAFFDKRSKFVHYRPRTLILNNLEFDHADIFDNVEAIERQFHHLVRTVPASGRIVVNGDDESLQRVLRKGCWSEVITFGLEGDYRAIGSPDQFSVQDASKNKVVTTVRWDLQGTHNVYNALAALAAAGHVGAWAPRLAEPLNSFTSVKRRMEVRGEVNGVTVYDDFAHHPSAIRTTVDGLRAKLGKAGRIIAVFEPRSNTMKLGTMKSQLPWALENADLVFCHSGGLDWDANEALAPMGSRAEVIGPLSEVVEFVEKVARPGDHILCMSNGSFGGVHQKLLDALKAPRGYRVLVNADQVWKILEAKGANPNFFSSENFERATGWKLRYDEQLHGSELYVIEFESEDAAVPLFALLHDFSQETEWLVEYVGEVEGEPSVVRMRAASAEDACRKLERAAQPYLRSISASPIL